MAELYLNALCCGRSSYGCMAYNVLAREQDPAFLSKESEREIQTCHH
jgi:hypothetical protein